MKKIYFISVLLSLSLLLQAKSYFLSTTGSDDNDGLTPQSPWLNIQQSINKLSSSNRDTLYFLPGTYSIDQTIVVPPGISLVGYTNDPAEVVLECISESVSTMVDLKTATKKSFAGSFFVDGNQTVSFLTINGAKLAYAGIVAAARNHVKFKNIHVLNCVSKGMVLSAFEADYSNHYQSKRIIGAEISNCVVKECSRLIPDSDYLYTSCVYIGGWEGGRMHHNYIYDKEGDATQSGQALTIMGMTRSKVHDNTMIINADIHNHWGGVFSVLTGYTAGLEFYNNTVNTGISCEHRIDEEKMIIPGVRNLYIHHNNFILDSPTFHGVQAIEIYVDYSEISHNYFENFSFNIQSWLGDDTLTNVLIHHNIFNGNGGGRALSFQMGGSSYSNPERHTVYEGFKVYNNTFNGFSDVVDNGHGQVENLEAYNNVFMNITRSVWRHFVDEYAEDPVNVVFDNNLQYQVSAFATDNSVTPANIIESDPGLNLSGDKPNPYYAASSGSSAVVDAGIVISSITDGYAGTAPDLGAYERDGTTPVRLLAPDISPYAGEYYQQVEIAMADSNANANIYYTLDGTDPDPGTGVLYTEPFVITENTVVKAACFQDNMLTSYINSAEYLVQTEKVDDLSFGKYPGGYGYPIVVPITTTTSGATIYYTTDGSTPSERNGDIYSAPIYVDGNVIINAIAIKDGAFPSHVLSGSFKVDLKEYAEGQYINDDDAGILYSDDFWNYETGKTNEYQNDLHSCFSQNSYFEYDFYGTGVMYLAPRKNSLSEEITIYIDDELLTKRSLYSKTEMHQDTILNYLRLSQGDHTIKVVKTSLLGNFVLDALVIYDDLSIDIDKHNTTEVFTFYPNPVEVVLTVGLTSESHSHLKFKIYSLDGKLQYSAHDKALPGKNNLNFDIGTLKSGTYIGKVETAGHINQFIVVKK